MNIEIERGFNAKAQVFIDLQNQATKKMEQLEERNFSFKISRQGDSCLEWDFEKDKLIRIKG